jgi:TetR/AcrR family transcriptional regulator, transcriptional repressor for nem operon
MSDSSVQTRSGKRERLIASARTLFHEHGVHRTTLAEVADRANVPLGNVYYYFRTKDDLVGAVLESYTQEAAELLEEFERHRSPKARLKALVGNWDSMRDAVAEHGCPMGSLCSELEKSDGEAAADAAALLAIIIEWAEDQFRQLGRRDARDLALRLFAGVQGAALLANTFRDPTIIARQGRQLGRWIDSIDSPSDVARVRR